MSFNRFCREQLHCWRIVWS